MGKVLVAARIECIDDLVLANEGHKKLEDVRRVEIPDALVDTGASTLSLPKRVVTQLGLRPGRTRQARTSAGTTTLQMYSAVRLTIQDRDCTCDVLEIPDECPVLIGQIPLEMLDFVVDPNGQRLIGNPEHGGEDIIELY